MPDLNNSFPGDLFQFTCDHYEGRIFSLKHSAHVEFTMTRNLPQLEWGLSTLLYCQPLHELGAGLPS